MRKRWLRKNTGCGSGNHGSWGDGDLFVLRLLILSRHGAGFFFLIMCACVRGCARVCARVRCVYRPSWRKCSLVAAAGALWQQLEMFGAGGCRREAACIFLRDSGCTMAMFWWFFVVWWENRRASCGGQRWAKWRPDDFFSLVFGSLEEEGKRAGRGRKKRGDGVLFLCGWGWLGGSVIWLIWLIWLGGGEHRWDKTRGRAAGKTGQCFLGGGGGQREEDRGRRAEGEGRGARGGGVVATR